MGRVICLVMGYVFGLFQTGYLYGKMNHIDIRNYGKKSGAHRVRGRFFKDGVRLSCGADHL